MMKLAPCALALTLVASPVIAQEVAPGDQIGTEIGAIASALSERGYEVRKTEREDGKVEVYAVREGRRFEIYVDPETGAVTRVKEKH